MTAMTTTSYEPTPPADPATMRRADLEREVRDLRRWTEQVTDLWRRSLTPARFELIYKADHVPDIGELIDLLAAERDALAAEVEALRAKAAPEHPDPNVPVAAGPDVARPTHGSSDA